MPRDLCPYHDIRIIQHSNPHAHILLTMCAMDENGKWLPKCREVYDLDENGDHIRLSSGHWKSHKESTVDWDDHKYGEIWRQGWSDTVNRYLEALGCPESLDGHLDTVSGKTSVIRIGMRQMEKRIEVIDTLFSYIESYEKYKPVHAEYAAIGWKGKKKNFAAAHREELDAYNAAVRYFKANLQGTAYNRQELKDEHQQLSGSVAEQTEQLQAVQADVKVLRDVCRWINQVLPPEQYRQHSELDGKKSLQSEIKGRAERIKRQQAAKSQPPRTQRKQNMEL